MEADIKPKDIAFPGKGRLSPEEARIKGLEKELERIKRERDILKYAFIEEQANRYSVRELCRVFEVGVSGYYGWRNNKISAKDRRDAYLSVMIKEIHRNSRGIYGCPRIYAELKASGERISYKRTYRLMKENNIQGKHRRKFKVTTNSKHNNPIFPNLLEQNFKVTAPNQVWVSDISYF